MLFKPLLVIVLSVSGVLSQWEWGVTYTTERICALKGSSVDMRCTYSYPTSHTVQKTFWFIHWNKPQEPEDLSQNAEYSGRVEYLGNKHSDCTFRINQLKESDSAIYRFRFLTNIQDGKYFGQPGVSLTVIGLQVKVTENEAQSVTLTCSSTCTLSGSPTFTWYKNRKVVSNENKYSLNLASTDDTDLYSCATGGVTSPAVNVKCVKVEIIFDRVSGGETVELICRATCSHLTESNSFIWYKNEQLVTSDYRFYQSYIKFTARREDAGSYSCAVRGHENLPSPAVTLYPPIITSVSVSPPGEIVEGSSVTLTCSSDANPPVQRYAWFKKTGSEFLSRGSEQSYTINKINSWDAGEYYCEAQNAIGTDRSPHVHLKVQCLKVDINSDTVSGGETVKLTCTATCTHLTESNSFIWYKNEQLLTDYYRIYQPYRILKFTARSGDTGRYSCAVRDNQHLVSPAVTLSVRCVKVEIKSDTVSEGVRVTLICKTCTDLTGSQTFIWYKNGQSPQNTAQKYQNHNYLQFKASSGDAGSYSCAVRGHENLLSPAVTLYPPKSILLSVPPSGEIVEGSSVTLTCSSSDANPSVQRYTWYKNNRAVSSETGGPVDRYTVKNITLLDAGEYTCQAENGIGTNRSPPIRLDVQYPPKSVSVSVSPSGEIVEGSSVTLTCSSDANPPVQRYTWFKKNDTVWQAGSGQSLNFSNFTSWNRGQYYCEAQNKHGGQNSTAVSINIEGGQSLIALAAVGVAAILALVFLGVVCVRRRKSTNETEGDRQGNKSSNYGNVSGMAMSHTGTQGTDRDDGEVPLYASVQPTNTRNQEQVLYSTVQKPLPQCEEGVQYASIQIRPSSAATRSPAPSIKEDCVLYSTLRKLDM